VESHDKQFIILPQSGEATNLLALSLTSSEPIIDMNIIIVPWLLFDGSTDISLLTRGTIAKLFLYTPFYMFYSYCHSSVGHHFWLIMNFAVALNL